MNKMGRWGECKSDRRDSLGKNIVPGFENSKECALIFGVDIFDPL